MKLRDGMWLTAADKQIEYAECIYSIDELDEGKGLRLLCPAKRIRSRGDTLNCPTLTVDLKAEYENVISLELTHWRGERKKKPEFELFPADRPEASPSITDSDGAKTLRSGALAVTARPDNYSFELSFDAPDSGKQLTSLRDRSVGFAYAPPPGNMKETASIANKEHYVFTQTDLAVGESIHGLGERFGAFNKVGQEVKVWNEDGGTSSEQAYKNISFWLSSRGYGVFIDTPDLIDLEIGSERSCRVQTIVKSQSVKWYLIYGPTPKEVLTRYSVLTGKSPLPPAWSFGLWLTTSFTTSYDEKTVGQFLQGMKDREIALEVFHYDCFWMRAFHWCDFVFSKEHFPDPAGSIKRLKEAGLMKKVCVWINPYLGQASPVFDYAMEKGYLLKRTNGDVWQWDLWQGGMALIDFTNPEACAWYVSCLKQLFDTGVDCLKTDFGERIPTQDVVWHDSKMDPSRMHNFYPFLFNKLCYEAVGDRHGKENAILFARSATAGTQRFPLCWGGDCESTPAALAESIRGGLSIGLSGFSFWSCDIGGFEGNPAPWIYKRWVAFGLLCSHSRLHGSNSYRVPWLIDEDAQGPQSATGVVRSFTKLKRSLMPYIYAQAKESADNGWPSSLRAMCLEFPEDPTSWFLDRQFMLGSQLLVAPVFTENGEVDVYLPPGKWYNHWTGEAVQGPGWQHERHDFDKLPLYWREGTVLLLGDEGTAGDSFDYDWFSGKGEVRRYGTNTGDAAFLVTNKGQEIGKVIIGEEGQVLEAEKLHGQWSY